MKNIDNTIVNNELIETPYQRVMRRYKWAKRIGLPILLIGLLVSLYSYTGLLLSYHFVLRWVVVLMIFVFIPGVVLNIFRSWLSFEKRENWKYGVFMLAAVINISIYLLWIDVLQLKTYKRLGVKTTAIVTTSYSIKGHDIVYQFSVGYDAYTARVSNIKDYVVGDTVEIIYNKDMPEMSELLDDFKRDLNDD